MAGTREVVVPDIGDFKDVDVAEVLVKPGDHVTAEQSLISVESDKSTMEIPSPEAGVVAAVKVNVGDKVSQGSVILTLEGGDGGVPTADGAAPTAKAAEASPSPLEEAVESADARAPEPEAPAERKTEDTPQTPPAVAPSASSPSVSSPSVSPVPVEPVSESPRFKPHASPSVRAFARELGVDLARVKGTAPKGRIQRSDVQAHVKGLLQGSAAAPVPAAGALPFRIIDWPQVDFAKFGPVESQPLSRIRKLTGANLHRNWVSIPHVTQFDEADITELEAFRKANTGESEKQGFKLTLLAFLVKACVTALRQFPQFNASLDKTGENLIVKKYYHIGVAVDTDDGLVVPVLKDADRKGVFDLARELSQLSQLARERKLKPGDMQGGTFSISSLGGIGGTLFTPIINAPEVAILGVSRSSMRQVFLNGQFQPRLVLPLSLSYDHRVIDGAAGARFTSYLSSVLSDIRRSLL